MNETGVYDLDWLDLEWTPWKSLQSGSGTIATLPTDPGLYRARHDDIDGLVYVGETGRSVRGRVRSFAGGIFDGEMPYRDPHTASPCLWAIVDRYGPELEISVATPDEAREKQRRKGLEDALLSLHRRVFEESPTANFARIIPGYEQSSYRKDGVVGGPLSDGETEPNAEPGIGPLPWESPDDPTSPRWMGLDWSEPAPLREATGLRPVPGLYRIWIPDGTDRLEYVGETANLRSRLYTHRRQRDANLHFSYVRRPELDARHERAEAETDLLGAHWLALGRAPRDQY